MKLSRKIIGYLASSCVIGAAAITVACASNSFTPTPEHDDPGYDVDVYFDASQSKVYNVNADTYDNFQVGNFRFSRDLGAGEEVIVRSTINEVKLVDSGYMPHPISTFSLATRIDSETEPEEDVTYQFGYIFEFYLEDKLMSTKRIDNFTVKYTHADPEQNSLTWALNNDADKSYQLEAGQKSIEISGFKLARPINPDINEKVTFEIEAETGDPQFTISEPTYDGTTVKATVTFVNAVELAGTEYGFHINWKLEDSLSRSTTGIVGNFKIYEKIAYEAPWVEIQNLPESHTVDKVTDEGVMGITLNSFANSKTDDQIFFNLNRPLAQNERVTAYTTNKNIGLTASVSPYEWERPDTNTDVPLVDLTIDIESIGNIFEDVNDETFFITFCFYEGNQLRAVQDLKFGQGSEDYLPFTIDYTPLVDPEPDIPNNYGIAFNAAVADTQGTGVFTFIGKVARDTDPTGELGLQPGDYMTIYNQDLGEEVVGRGGSSTTRNLLTFAQPANEVEFIEKDDKLSEKPSAKIVGTGQTEIQFQMKWFVPEYDAENDTFLVPSWWDSDNHSSPAMLHDVFDFISDLEIEFRDNQDKEINKQPAEIDFLLYPPGFWTGTSDEVVDSWISNRSLALYCSYNDDNDVKKIIDGTAWVMSISLVEYEPRDKQIFNFISSWDVINELKWVLDNPEHDADWLKNHDVKIGFGFPLSGMTYNIQNLDATRYLSTSDFILPNFVQAKEDGLEYSINFPESDPMVWDGDSGTNGSNLGVLQMDFNFFLDYSVDPDFALDESLIERNARLYLKSFVPWMELIGASMSSEEAIDVDGHIYVTNCQGLHNETTGEGTKTPITNWDEIKANYSNAVIAGFSSKELEIDGKKDLYYYWKTKSVNFSSTARPSYKTIEDSAAQNFANLTDDVKHQSYAYELPNSYNLDPNDEDGWFSSAGRGAMMVARQWKTIGEGTEEHQIIDIPRVIGINWNGGVESSIGTNMFKPWIDLFWWRDQDTSINLLEDYFIPMM